MGSWTPPAALPLLPSAAGPSPQSSPAPPRLRPANFPPLPSPPTSCTAASALLPSSPRLSALPPLLLISMLWLPLVSILRLLLVSIHQLLVAIIRRQLVSMLRLPLWKGRLEIRREPSFGRSDRRRETSIRRCGGRHETSSGRRFRRTVSTWEAKRGRRDKVLREFKRPAGATEKEIDAAGDGDVLVILDLRADESLFDVGVAREVVNRIQKLRKKSGLEPTDIVEVYYESLEKDQKVLEKIVNSQEEYIKDALGSPLLHQSWIRSEAVILCQEEFQISLSREDLPSVAFIISIAKPTLVFVSETIVPLYSGDEKHAENLQVYLLSRDISNLRSEFQGGNGQIKVDCIENQPAVNLEMEKHLFLSVGDFYLRRKTCR